MRDSNIAHESIILVDGTIDLEADLSTIALVNFEKQNHAATKILNEGRFNSDVFKKYAPTKKTPQAVTAANSRAHQDTLSLVRHSSQHSILLAVTR